MTKKALKPFIGKLVRIRWRDPRRFRRPVGRQERDSVHTDWRDSTLTGDTDMKRVLLALLLVAVLLGGCSHAVVSNKFNHYAALAIV